LYRPTLKILRAHGLSLCESTGCFPLCDFSVALYASRAWWGSAGAQDREKVYEFLRCSSLIYPVSTIYAFKKIKICSTKVYITQTMFYTVYSRPSVIPRTIIPLNRRHTIEHCLNNFYIYRLQFYYSGVIIPPPTRSSGRRYYVLLQKFLSLFSFAKGSPRWLKRQGTFIAQMVGYRCNFKKLGPKFGRRPAIKIWGTQTPNVVNQSRRTWSKLILGTGRENDYPKLVSKFWGLSPKKLRGQSLEISILKLALLRGHRSHTLQIFTSGSGS